MKAKRGVFYYEVSIYKIFLFAFDFETASILIIDKNIDFEFSFY